MQSHKQQHDSVEIQETPAAPTIGFDAFDLPAALAKSLHHMKYTNPTPIQMQAIPAVIKGKDLLASAQTGTGKTGAFIIPILSKLMLDPHAHCIIMAPTRELAAQILAVAHQMAHGHVAIKTALLIGGEAMGRQRAQLSARPRLIIGTPGRMNDHLRSNPRMYEKTSMLVLDEADRMLDMGFAPQIKEIIQTTNPKRQTLMFSATFPDNIMKFAQAYLRDPIRISIEPERTSAANIKHEEVKTTEGARYAELLHQFDNREGSIIVFIKTKHGADRMVKKLAEAKYSVDVIHGGLNQRQRDRAIIGFRNGKTRIMIATDVAARGLDVPHIEHVINYDLPQVPEDYVHRIGRTGRNGKEGTAVSFIMPSEMGKWRAIQRILNPNAPRTGPEDHGRNRPAKKGSFKANRERVYDRNAERRPERNSDTRFRPQMDNLTMDSANEKPRFEKKSFGDKPRSFGDRSDKPRFDKPRFDKPRGEGNFRPREDREPNGNVRPSNPDAPHAERKIFGDKPRSNGPRFEKKWDGKPKFNGPRTGGAGKPRTGGNGGKPFFKKRERD